jgi:hypothetical protein
MLTLFRVRTAASLECLRGHFLGREFCCETFFRDRLSYCMCVIHIEMEVKVLSSGANQGLEGNARVEMKSAF